MSNRISKTGKSCWKTARSIRKLCLFPKCTLNGYLNSEEVLSIVSVGGERGASSLWADGSRWNQRETDRQDR